jgi:hypothetical protein
MAASSAQAVFFSSPPPPPETGEVVASPPSQLVSRQGLRDLAHGALSLCREVAKETCVEVLSNDADALAFQIEFEHARQNLAFLRETKLLAFANIGG